MTRWIFVAALLALLPAAPAPVHAQSDSVPSLPPRKPFTNDLPLKRPDVAVGVHGYPALNIDRVAVAASLIEGRIEELEALLADLRDRTLADIRWEEHLVEAYWAFHRSDPEFGEFTRAWMASAPGSAAAHIAFAKQTLARAWTLQDGRAAANIPEDELDAMRGFMARADQVVDLAIALDPENLAAYTMKLEVLQLSGATEESATVTETALRVFPESFSLRKQAMSNASPRWLGSVERMEALWRDAETRLAENPRLRVVRGLAYSEFADWRRMEGRFAEAVQMHDSALALGDEILAIALDPENLAAYTMKLEVLQLSGATEESATVTETALRVFPESFSLRKQAMSNASPRWLGSVERMEALWRDAETRLAENPRLRVVRGLAYSEFADWRRMEGRFAEAVQMHDSALALGDDATIFLDRARAYYGAGDYVRALEDVNRSARLRPQSFGMVELRAQTLYGIGSMAPLDGKIAVGNNLYRDLELLVALQPDNEWAAKELASFASAGLDDPNVLTVIRHTLEDIYSMFHEYSVFPHWVVLFAMLGANLLLWKRSGYWMPRYVHVLALAALGVILWINWLWVRAGGAMWTRRYVIIAFFPGLVYFTFITFGGLRAAIWHREKSLPPEDLVGQPPSTSTVDTSPAGPQVRPWIRFWARALDYSFAQFAGTMSLGVLAVFDSPVRLWASPAVFGLLFYVTWHFIEAVLLSTWGTTPGKWFFRVSVRTPDSRRPSLSAALKRSFLLWWRFIGVGIPIVMLVMLLTGLHDLWGGTDIVMLFTGIYAYRVLAKQRRTTWDRDTHLEVSHEIIGAPRVIFACAGGLAFLFLAVLGGMY